MISIRRYLGIIKGSLGMLVNSPLIDLNMVASGAYLPLTLNQQHDRCDKEVLRAASHYSATFGGALRPRRANVCPSWVVS